MKNIFKDLWKFLFPILVLVVLSSVIWLSGVELYNSGKASVSSVQQEDNTLQIQINKLQNNLDAKRAENASLSAQVTSLQADKTELENTQTELLSQIQSNEAENTALQSQINTLEAEKEALLESGQASQDEIDNLNTQISTLNETILANETENTNLQTQVTSLTSEVETLDAEIDTLNETISTNQQTITQLNAKVSKYMSIFNKTITEITAEDLDGFTSIDSYMFANCSNLSSIEIPEGITTICDGAFYGCTSLTEIIFPSSVTLVEGSPFALCKNLKIGFLSSNVELQSKNGYSASYLSKVGFISGANVSGSGYDNMELSLEHTIFKVTADIGSDSVVSLGDGWELDGTTLTKMYWTKTANPSTWGTLPTLSDRSITIFLGWSTSSDSLDVISSTDIVDSSVIKLYSVYDSGSSGEWEGPVIGE